MWTDQYADVSCLNRDQRLVSQFIPGEFRLLGQGAEGVVVRAVLRKSNEEVAVKLITRASLAGKGEGHQAAKKHALRELQNHSTLCHPLIVGYKRAFVSDRYLVIVMERLKARLGYPGEPIKSLVDMLKMWGGGLGEDIARHYFQQLIVAVDYCHRMKVTNRDIKLEHCLLHVTPGMDRDHLPLLKLCDWGHSKSCRIGSSMPGSLVGTPGYWAPEVVIHHRDNRHYDAYLADVFSCGVILWKLLYGYGEWPAGDADEERRLQREGATELYLLNLKKQQEGINLRLHGSQKVCRSLMHPIEHNCEEECVQFTFELDGDLGAHLGCSATKVSPECTELLERMLQTDYNKRCKIKYILEHRWFRKNLPKDSESLNDFVCSPEYRNRIAHYIPQAEKLKELVCRAAGEPV